MLRDFGSLNNGFYIMARYNGGFLDSDLENTKLKVIILVLGCMTITKIASVLF